MSVYAQDIYRRGVDVHLQPRPLAFSLQIFSKPYDALSNVPSRRQSGTVRPNPLQRPTKDHDIQMAVNAHEKPGSNTGGNGFKTFRVKVLHPTFGAEIEGVNFPDPGKEQFPELMRAMAKV
jgi:hypothetical protein